MSDIAIHVHGLGKRYRIWTHHRPTSLKERITTVLPGASPADGPARDEIWALRNVSFDVPRGEIFGVIGANGAGKSTLLSILARITAPTEGYCEIRGRVSSLLEVGTGFHPELSGRDNVFLNGAFLGMSRAETRRKFDQIVDFSELGDLIDMPVKRYSTGMYMRLAFAVAAHLDPEVLLLDEVLSVGDAAFQEKSLARIDDITRSGRTVLFVSHDAASVANLCTRGLYLRDGEVEFVGDIDDALERYLGKRPRLIPGGGDLVDVARDGTGDARVSSLGVVNSDGGTTIRPDEPFVIEAVVDTRSLETTEDVELEVAITSPVLGPLVGLVAPLGGGIPSSRTITARCTVGELPLRSGTYFMSVALLRHDVVLDRVLNQVEVVIEGPRSRSGLHSLRGTPVLVRHQWEVIASSSRRPVVKR